MKGLTNEERRILELSSGEELYDSDMPICEDLIAQGRLTVRDDVDRTLWDNTPAGDEALRYDRIARELG